MGLLYDHPLEVSSHVRPKQFLPPLLVKMVVWLILLVSARVCLSCERFFNLNILSLRLANLRRIKSVHKFSKSHALQLSFYQQLEQHDIDVNDNGQNPCN